MKNEEQDKEKQKIDWRKLVAILMYIGLMFYAAYFSINIWDILHQPLVVSKEPQQILYPLAIIFGIIFGSLVAVWGYSKQKSSFWLLLFYLSIVIFSFPVVVGINLLFIDLVTIFSGKVSVNDFYANDPYNFYFKFYSGTLAIIAFGVTLFVAYVRHQGLQQAQKNFELSQQ